MTRDPHIATLRNAHNGGRQNRKTEKERERETPTGLGERARSRVLLRGEREREISPPKTLGSSAKITASGVGTRPLLLRGLACVVRVDVRARARGENYHRLPRRAA